MTRHIDRRTFVTTVAAGFAAAPAILEARQKTRYPIAFSTLGCPAWSWKNVLDQASRHGYVALELRGIAGEMDLTKVPELTGTQLATTMKDLSGTRDRRVGSRGVRRDARDGRGAREGA